MHDFVGLARANLVLLSRGGWSGEPGGASHFPSKNIDKIPVLDDKHAVTLVQPPVAYLNPAAQSFPRRNRFRLGLLLLLALLPGSGSAAAGQDNTNAELRTVAAIRDLSPAQTALNIPAHLHGVVTFFNEQLYSRFMADDTAGIYLQFPVNMGPPPLYPGQIVDVTGTVSPGEYAPVVVVQHIQTAGLGKLPEPRPVTYEDLASGAEDSQFVQVQGIVHSIHKPEANAFYEIEIVTGGGRLLAVANVLPITRPEELVDSAVRVSGVCSTKFNHQRQLFAIRLMVPGPEYLQILTPAPDQPYDITPRAAGSLLQFTPKARYGHRVKVVGTVTYCDPGSTLYLQDAEHGVQVQTRSTVPVKPGDEVEVLGFAAQGDYTPVLQDSVYRQRGIGHAVQPINVNPDGALTGNFDCEVIRLTARVIDRTRTPRENFLLLQQGGVIFQASLKHAGVTDDFAAVPNGSLVSLTGVCRIDPGEWIPGNDWRAKAFSVLLRTPGDVTILEAPPWWTVKRVLWIAGALAFVLFAAVGWVLVLRRQVAERTRELELQIQQRQSAERRREIEQERARVANDLHDDLGARLTEVNMLTTLTQSSATSAEEKRHYLGQLSETARQMVTSLDEIVWAVNPRNDTTASLASYFGAYAQRLLDLAGIACGLDIAERLPDHPLDPKFRHEIFFAFKEALTNVVRHARATRVWLRISVTGGELAVEVADDGHGLPAQEPLAGNDGLTNMDERLRSIGGRCEISSDVHRGTTVRFIAPLPRRIL